MEMSRSRARTLDASGQAWYEQREATEPGYDEEVEVCSVSGSYDGASSVPCKRPCTKVGQIEADSRFKTLLEPRDF